MTWDLIIVTARTAQQRWLFERYLEALWPGHREARAPDWMVLQDPPGPQLGTAGATIGGIAAAAERLGQRFAQRRVLLLHCGGLSQRVPQLAHVGKAFAPGAGAGRDVTLFAQVVTELGGLFRDSDPGVVVACGDVLYITPTLGMTCGRDETVAVAYPAPAEQASRHGVYLWDAGQTRIAEAWQKPDPSRLCSLPTGRRWGMDTGILYLGAGVVESLMRATRLTPTRQPPGAGGNGMGAWRGLELYRDLTPAMTLTWDEGMRLPGVPGSVQGALSLNPLRVVCPESAELHHFGTIVELMRILGGGGQPCVYGSYVAEGDLGAGVVMDRCLAERPIRIEAGSYVSGLNRPGTELWIGAARVAYQLPLRTGADGQRLDACIAIGVGDDTRRHPEEGATLLGEPLGDWLRELGEPAEAIWEGVPPRERSLWNARLFPIGGAGAVAASVPWLSVDDGGSGERTEQWRKSRRVSMGEAHRRFDARRWWAHEERIRAHRFAAEMKAAVRRGDGAQVGHLLADRELPAAARRLALQWLGQLGRSEAASLTGARAWFVASHLSTPTATETLRERGFRSLSQALLTHQYSRGGELQWRLAPGEGIEAQAPVRVDLVGGWTDTPPQACERGGTVLNLALLLDGQRPLQARVERLAEPVLELIAHDQGIRLPLSANPPARQRLDPRDPFALHLAGLQLVGLFSGAPLQERLRRLGGGLRLTTTAEVPKGSGLGASSILGAVLLAALYHGFGQEVTLRDLCGQVLQLEQLMGTGGGWQDQVGGMWGGIKFAHSAPGIDQDPVVETVELAPVSEEALEERMVLFYTGEPRLAKDVLQRVVGHYLVGGAPTIAALDEMPALARQARSALMCGDWNGLGACLNRSWELNRQLEPTSTNPGLDALFTRIAPFVSGAKLAGAGGGGFLLALARDGTARESLERALREIPPPARLYRATLDRDGLLIRRG